MFDLDTEKRKVDSMPDFVSSSNHLKSIKKSGFTQLFINNSS